MNIYHRWRCASNRWRETVHRYMMPSVVGDKPLGDDVLEIGPGPGATTDWLRERVPHLTSIEIDPKLASSLRSRLEGTNVTVVEGDATKMPFPDVSFTGAVSLTMLHHVPSTELQDRLFAETCRVLETGALFVGGDSTPSLQWNIAHLFDTRVPVDPDTLAVRLERAGFVAPKVTRSGRYFSFMARKP